MRFLLAFVFMLTPLSAQAKAPLGDWLVRGKNANQKATYKGHVSVIKSEQTYTVLWRFGTTTYIGTGVELNNHFAVTFRSSDGLKVGLLLMAKKGDVWQGKWAEMGAKQIGQETWSSIKQH